MKKIVIILLLVLMMFPCGCSNSNESVQSNVLNSENSKINDVTVSHSEVENSSSNIEVPDSIHLELNKETEGELADFDSVNIYKFTVLKSGLAEITFISPHKSNGQIGGTYYVSMYRAEEYNENSLWSEKCMGSDYLNTFCRSRLGVGDYYIEISGDDVDVPEFGYKIKVNFVKEEDKPNIEKEWNDNFEYACPIPVNTEITGNLNTLESHYVNYDEDYYIFSLSEESVVHLNVRVLGYAPDKYNVSMYDSNYTGIMNSDVIGNGKEYGSSKCKTMRLEAGNYYVKFSYGGTSSVNLEKSADYFFEVVIE